jgi:hypothetical protein
MTEEKMTRHIRGVISGAIFAVAVLSSTGALAKPKCSAPDVMDFEGTDQSGITKTCEAIFSACIDESAPCKTRKQNCAKYEKMDRDGSCYKKGKS